MAWQNIAPESKAEPRGRKKPLISQHIKGRHPAGEAVCMCIIAAASSAAKGWPPECRNGILGPSRRIPRGDRT
jgi:hypothetical protein